MIAYFCNKLTSPPSARRNHKAKSRYYKIAKYENRRLSNMKYDNPQKYLFIGNDETTFMLISGKLIFLVTAIKQSSVCAYEHYVRFDFSETTGPTNAY